MNKQIFYIESGKLLVKTPSEKWIALVTFFVVVAVLYFLCFLLAFAFVVAVVTVVIACFFVFPSRVFKFQFFTAFFVFALFYCIGI